MLNKRNFFSILLFISVLTGCSSTTKLIGNQVDSHHCLTSAGYQWSQLQQQCVRVFESGIHLLPLNSTLSSAAFILINANPTKVELFVPTQQHSLLLKKTPNKNQWQAGQFKLIQTGSQQWQLYINNNLSYQSHSKTN